MPGAILFVVVLAASWMSLTMLGKDNQQNDAALIAALLEKDFASLERDAFHYIITRTPEARTAFDANVADLATSLEEARIATGGTMDRELDTVLHLAGDYALLVNRVVAGPVPEGERAATSLVFVHGARVDSAIELVRDSAIREAAAVREQHETLLEWSFALCAMSGILATLASLAIARIQSPRLLPVAAQEEAPEYPEIDLLPPLLADPAAVLHALPGLRPVHLAAHSDRTAALPAWTPADVFARS